MYKNNSSVMKRWIAGLSATFVMALSGLVPQPSHSQPKKTLSLSDVTFRCYLVNEMPTVVALLRGQRLGIPIFIWDWRNIRLNYSPESMCRQVSNRFEIARKLDLLKYINIGVLNGRKIMCAVENFSDSCSERESLFLSLLPDDFGNQDLLKIFGIRYEDPIIRGDYKPKINITDLIGYSTPRFEIDRRIISFTCSTSSEIPTTIVRTSKGDIPIIIWKSESFASSGWTRGKRCQEVSDRFDKLKYNNSLNYITSGVIDEQSIICGVETQTDLCSPENILFTLDENSDPQKILKQMFLANADIQIDDDGVGKLKDGRDFVCMSRSASGNCSGLLISGIEL
jgi:hypothetical protein